MYGSHGAILHVYGSHDVRHIDFRGLTGGQRTPQDWGVTLDIPKHKITKITAIGNK